MKRGLSVAYATMLAFLVFASLSFAVTLNLVTGSEKGTYYQFGLNLKELVQSKGIELGVHPSTGSIENLYAVYQRPQTQIGIVQSDVLAFVSRVKTNPMLVHIAQKTKLVFPLYNEEIHVLGRQGLGDFDNLAGKRVAIGEEGSGTYLTARLLLEVTGIKPAELVMVGTSEALSRLKANRIDAMFYILQSLTPSETGDYIAHRLKLAGRDEPIFTAAAVQEISRFSRGIPRLINILCDQALLIGYSTDLKMIGPEIIKESRQNTLIPLQAPQELSVAEPAGEPAQGPLSTAAAVEGVGPAPIAPPAMDAAPSSPKTTYYIPIALIIILGLAVFLYINDGFRIATTDSRKDIAGTVSGPQPPDVVQTDGDAARLQSQMMELRKQKDEAETRLQELQTRLQASESEHQQAKAAKMRAAELESAMVSKDKDLAEASQKLTDLEKNQIQELKTQKPASSSTPAPARAPVPPPSVPSDPAGGAPDPAGIIDFVIKKKTR